MEALKRSGGPPHWLVGAAVLLALSACAPDPTSDLTAVPVRSGPFVVEVETEAVVRPLDSHAIAVPNGVWGSIETLAPEGKPVEKGELVAKISVRELEEDLTDMQDQLAREERKLARLKADAPVKRYEIEKELLDKQREFRAAELNARTAERGGRADALEAAKRDLAVAKLRLASDPLEKKRALHAQGVIADRELDRSELDRALAEISRQRARLALEAVMPGAATEAIDKARLRSAKARSEVEGLEIEAPAKAELLKLDQQKSKVRAKRLKKRAEKLAQRLAGASLYAPGDGLLLYPMIWGWQKPHVGMEVWQGLSFLEVARLDRVKLEGSVSEAEIAKVRTGAAVSITADGYPGRVFKGKVGRVSKLAKEEQGAAATAGVKRFDLEVLPDGATPELKPNMRVKLRILHASVPEATSIPADALFGSPRAHHVWLATERGPQKHPVEPGLRNEDWIALAAPLAEGARVYLVDPTTFKARREEAPAPAGTVAP